MADEQGQKPNPGEICSDDDCEYVFVHVHGI